MAEILNVSPVWLMGFDVPKKDPKYDIVMKAYLPNSKTAKIMQEIETLLADTSEDRLSEILNYIKFVHERK